MSDFLEAERANCLLRRRVWLAWFGRVPLDQLGVLIAIALSTDEDGNSYASLERLSDIALDLPEDDTLAAIAALQDVGAIQVEDGVYRVVLGSDRGFERVMATTLRGAAR